MALPTTISGAGTPQAHSLYPPMVSSGGAVYVIAQLSGNDLGAYKATDPTSSFAEQDGANRPSMSGFNNSWAYQDGDIAHVIRVRSSPAASAAYSKFDMSADSWTLFTGDADATIISGIDTSVPSVGASSLVVSSTGEIVGAINGAVDKVMGQDRARIDMVRSTNGTSWTVEDATNATNAEIDFTGPVCVLGASDRVHIFYKDNTNDLLLVSTLLSNNTWGSRGVTVTSSNITPAYAFPIGRGVNLGGVIYVPYRQGVPSNLGAVANFTSADTPSGFTVTEVTETAPTASGDDVMIGLSLEGTNIHLLFVNGLNINHDVNSGAGWGTDSTERTLGVVPDHLSSNVIDR